MIHYKRISLRALVASDATTYEQWINDEETNFWRGLYHPTSSIDATKWVAQQSEQQADRFAFAVDVKDKDGRVRPIGFVGMRGINGRSARAELWIYIGDKSCWSEGFGGEVITALCQYAFDEMNLFRIWLETNPEHEGAMRCYEKVGFVREGTLRQAYYRRGKYRDTCIMGLLRPDFEQKRATQG